MIVRNLGVIKTAEWMIDMGPEGGVNGGEIVAEGMPEDVVLTASDHAIRVECFCSEG